MSCVLLLHKSRCSLVAKDHPAVGSSLMVPRRVSVQQSDKESASLRHLVNSSVHLWKPEFEYQKASGLESALITLIGLSNDTTISRKDHVTVHWGNFIPNICKDLKGTCINSIHWLQAVSLAIWDKRITSCRVASGNVTITMSSLLYDLGVACVMTKLT